MIYQQKEPVSHFINVGGYEIHVTEWGVDNAEAILMWHGLARTGRDFDFLAEHLSSRYRVLCPDTLGRGLSEWSTNPTEEYCYNFYEKIALKICETFGLFHFDYIGTSMGGALGMWLASDKLKDNINHLIINDIGPEVPQAAIDRILTYVGNPKTFKSYQEFEDFLREAYAPFGYLTDQQWRHICETSARRTDKGLITPHYDPNIVDQFKYHQDDYENWDRYENISAPTLVLRGVLSDLFLPDCAEKMTQCGPKAQIVEIEGCGHNPALNRDHQYNIIKDFLDQ